MKFEKVCATLFIGDSSFITFADRPPFFNNNFGRFSRKAHIQKLEIKKNFAIDIHISMNISNNVT